MIILIYLLIGALAGFMAGLFGIGGGMIIVPILYWTFTHLGYDPQYIMQMALGTSLATIMVTSVSSVMAHQKKKAILWHVVKHLTPGLMLGAFLGAGIADALPGHILQLLIGGFALWVAYQMFRGAQAVVDTQRQLPSAAQQTIMGGVIGVASAIFGIGGGSLTVPYLNKSGVVMQKAVATSAAGGFPIAVAGAIGFMVFGASHATAIPQAIGYVHIYAFLGISLMSFITAKVGAKVAHQLSPSGLKKCFAFFLSGVGLFFIYKAVTGFL